MPQTVTATLYKTFKSKAAGVAATHVPGSPEVITINHRLGACPDEIRVVRRTIIAFGAVSVGAGSTASAALIAAPAGLIVRSWNASQVLLDGEGVAPGTASTWIVGSPTLALFDIIAEKYHSIDG